MAKSSKPLNPSQPPRNWQQSAQALKTLAKPKGPRLYDRLTAIEDLIKGSK